MITAISNNTLFLVLKSARPRQWIKNLTMYAALVFSGLFFFAPASGVPHFVTVTGAFLLFNFLTSALYIINDILDIRADRNHPFKSKRPIASGRLPIPVAIFAAVSFLAIVFLGSFWLSGFFRLAVLGYFLLQVLYSKVTKHVPILDVMSIAGSFVLRIYAGALVVNLHMSVWFLLTVLSASLFLAVAKRQSERTLLREHLGETRTTLRHYSQRLLDQYTGMFANATWLTYSLFTFQHQFVGPRTKFTELVVSLPQTLQSQKLLMVTIPLVIFGVMRYLQLVYENDQGEAPEVIILKDKAILSTVFALAISVMVIIYVIG